MLNSILRRASHFYRAKSFYISSAHSLISFTFDGFPKSAVTEGAKILESFDAIGTFYASSAPVGSKNPGNLEYDFSDLKTLQSFGHEIGCHTFSHTGLLGKSGQEIIDEIRNNLDALQPFLGGLGLSNFSYPYGDCSILSRKIISRKFLTGRGNRSGINRHMVDLSDLRANSIYCHTYDGSLLERLIEKVASNGGWLIFYTRDVSSQPTRYGCTPRQLEHLVKYARQKSCEILSVKRAMAKNVFG